MPLNRRHFVKAGLITGATAGTAATVYAAIVKPPTPTEIEGPFYPVYPQKDKDFDLTIIEGNDAPALGRHIFIEGRVVDTLGRSIEDATVDFWQANAAGRYRHPSDKNTAPLDPNFQGWAIVPSGENGGFRFKTVFPGIYHVMGKWSRPPHIHFKVTKRGYHELITQMYFPGNSLNDKDLLLQHKMPEDRKLMISEKTSDEPETYRYTIVLAKAEAKPS